jgi:hypothetical protein
MMLWLPFALIFSQRAKKPSIGMRSRVARHIRQRQLQLHVENCQRLRLGGSAYGRRPRPAGPAPTAPPAWVVQALQNLGRRAFGRDRGCDTSTGHAGVGRASAKKKASKLPARQRAPISTIYLSQARRRGNAISTSVYLYLYLLRALAEPALQGLPAACRRPLA